MNFRYEYLLRCPRCKEATVLRNQTPSKKDEGLRCQPMGGVEIPFVCRTTGQMGSFCPEATLEEVDEHSPAANSLSPWMVVCECAQCNSGPPIGVFVIFDTNGEPGQLIDIVLRADPKIPCNGEHDVVLERIKMKASKLDW